MKHIVSLLLIFFLCFGCTETTPADGPENNVAWDFLPIRVEFEITDNEGHNLFDNNTPGNWLNSTIACYYDNKFYYYPQTKYVPVSFYGIKVIDNSCYSLDGTNWGPHLCFGDFERTKDIYASFTFYWPDDTLNEVILTHQFKWVDKDPYSKTTILLDNKQIEQMVIPLVKSPAKK